MGGLFEIGNPWWAAVDSNHLPPRYQHGALPVELAARQKAPMARPDPRSLAGPLDFTKAGSGPAKPRGGTGQPTEG